MPDRSAQLISSNDALGSFLVAEAARTLLRLQRFCHVPAGVGGRRCSRSRVIAPLKPSFPRSCASFAPAMTTVPNRREAIRGARALTVCGSPIPSTAAPRSAIAHATIGQRRSRYGKRVSPPLAPSPFQGRGSSIPPATWHTGEGSCGSQSGQTERFAWPSAFVMPRNGSPLSPQRSELTFNRPARAASR